MNEWNGTLLLLLRRIRLVIFVDRLYFPKSGDSLRKNAREGPSYAGLQAMGIVSIGCSSLLNHQIPCRRPTVNWQWSALIGAL